MMSHQPLTQEPNGHHASTQSETNNNVVHAGHLVLQKPFQTDSVLTQMDQSTLFSPLRTWLLATILTSDVVADISLTLGTILLKKVLSQIPVSHTPQGMVQYPSVKLIHAAFVQLPMLNTLVNPTLLLRPPLLTKSNPKSMLTVQLKLLSVSTLTS